MSYRLRPDFFFSAAEADSLKPILTSRLEVHQIFADFVLRTPKIIQDVSRNLRIRCNPSAISFQVSRNASERSVQFSDCAKAFLTPVQESNGMNQRKPSDQKLAMARTRKDRLSARLWMSLKPRRRR